MNPAMLAALQSGGVTIDPSLRLYIPFNEGVGAVAKDYSQYGNNGKLTDVEWGINGGVFNGTSAYVNCGNDPSLDITDAITIEAWVKANSDGQNHLGNILSNKDHPSTSGTGGYNLFISGILYQIGCNIKHTTTNAYRYPSLSTLMGSWTHFAAIYNEDGDKKIKIYRNSTLLTGGTDIAGVGTVVSPSENTLIGNYSNHNATFNGAIDGVKIYNRALSALEILQHYESERARYEV